MTEAASVASAAFTAAMRKSQLSVASEASASGASATFSADVRASAHHSWRLRREGPCVVVEVALDKHAEVVEADLRALTAG